MAKERITRGLLALTTIFLGMTALRPFVLPGPVHAEAVDLSHLQFQVEKTNAGVVLYFFDAKTGDVWTYNENGRPLLRYHLDTLGKPMTNQNAQAR